MSQNNLKTIVNQLNDFNARALEAAVAFATARRHYEVTVEHVLVKILEMGDSDLACLLSHFRLDQDALWQALLKNLDGQRAGNQGKPGFSPQLYKWLEHGLVANSLHYQQAKIRSIALLDALIPFALQLPGNLADVLQGVSIDDMRENAWQRVGASCENYGAADKAVYLPEASDLEQTKKSDTALARFTHDLTAKAEAGKIDPVIGREFEIRLMVDVLMRRRKNNPILIGEPGVGKTAIVEGFARQVASGDVPASLEKVRVHTLDLGLLQAGAGVKGEFEKRLQQVIEEVQNAASPIILFIDEAHTMIGAGGNAGSSDAANLLKPALARGELRTIAATTWAEYKQYFERDAALERRFQMVKVVEPTEEQALKIMSGLKDIYQAHHGILITDAALAAAVKLSNRYITGKKLPDKAIDLIDTAAARIHMAGSVMPSSIEALQAEQHYLTQRLADLTSQLNNGVAIDNPDLVNTLQVELDKNAGQLGVLTLQWQEEKALVEEILEQRKTVGVLLRAKEVDKAKFAWMQMAIKETQAELAMLQNNKPLVQAELDANVVADVVGDLTGVPVSNLLKDDISKLLELEQSLAENIIGQTTALSAIAQAIRTRRSGLGNQNAPLGVFLLAGPSGVGKTETARVVARELFGGDSFLTTINMSEYQEAHTVSQLKGSPPGYVGYGEGGILTEAVRQRPYCVILLDEVEKAHPDVMNMFYQVFDQGLLRDGEGREIDFRNTVIFITTNLGTEVIGQLAQAKASEASLDYAQVCAAVQQDLSQHFAAALLSRMQVFPYLPLTELELRSIGALKLDALAQRLQAAQGIQLRCDQAVLNLLATQALSPERGARALTSIINQQIEPVIARSVLNFMADDDMPEFLTLSIDEQDELSFVYSSAQVEPRLKPSLNEYVPHGYSN
jgi:type VI secretion system protein VasG